MDGSASPLFFNSIGRFGRTEDTKKFIKVKKEVSVSQGDKYAKFSPFSGFRVSFCIEFDHPFFYKKTNGSRFFHDIIR